MSWLVSPQSTDNDGGNIFVMCVWKTCFIKSMFCYFNYGVPTER